MDVSSLQSHTQEELLAMLPIRACGSWTCASSLEALRGVLLAELSKNSTHPLSHLLVARSCFGSYSGVSSILVIFAPTIQNVSGAHSERFAERAKQNDCAGSEEHTTRYSAGIGAGMH